MTERERDRIESMLQQMLPPVGHAAEPAHDLWPPLRQRLKEHPAPHARPASTTIPWFDCALAAGLVTLAAFFPVSIPVLLYYL